MIHSQDRMPPGGNGSGSVTICIPAFNAEDFIAQTLRSILGQSGVSEVYVSDNHSTDATMEVVRQFQGQGVALVQCPIMPVKTGDLLDNCRSSINNWNSLVQYGTGQYVALYHADDVYEPGIVTAQARFLDRHRECSVVFTMGKAIGENGRRFRVWNATLSHWLGPERLFDYRGLVQGLLEWGGFLNTPTAMIRREAWRRAGDLDPHYEQACDVEWWLRLAKVGPVGVINQELYLRRFSRNHDSARTKMIYRHCPLPLFKVLDDCLDRDGLRAQIPADILRKFELQRTGDLVGQGVLCIAEGKMQQGIEELARCRRLGLLSLARDLRGYPRPVIQILLGEILWQACRVGCGLVVARQMAKHSSIFGR
jgi:glycosyltransferase involved in cell wall biosynthesis